FVKLWPYDMSFTLQNYTVHTSGGVSAIWTSLIVAFITAIGGVVLLFMLAFSITLMKGLPSKSDYLLSLMPIGLPGLVIDLFSVRDLLVLCFFVRFYHPLSIYHLWHHIPDCDL